MVSAIRKSSKAIPETEVEQMIRRVFVELCLESSRMRKDQEQQSSLVNLYMAATGWGKQPPPHTHTVESNG